MIELRTQAITALEENVEKRKAIAIAEFRKDFGTAPDETSYLGENQFLFRADDLYVMGYIEYMGDQLYGKSYRLAEPCRHCAGWVLGEKAFFDLPGLGEAIKGEPNLKVCEKCALASLGRYLLALSKS